jgi:glycosyltransferase involved in cell wall biosynthesis
LNATPVRVLHLVTRMIVGGAQENTMLSCALIDRARFPSEIICGPETGAEGELHTETAARGVRLRIEPSLIRAIHPWKDLVALVRLTRLLRRERFDVVHTHSSKAGILGRIAARLAGTPMVIHTVHGWAFNPGQSRAVFGLYVWLERRCARWCRWIVVVAEADREEGLQLGIGRADQYQLIRSGIEVEAYRDVAIDRDAARRLLGVPAEAFVVGSVGRLSPQKAPLDLLTAFEHLAAVRKDAHLVIVGDGPLRKEVEARVSAAGLAGRVHLPGLRRDVPELLRAFDVFALASHWEGLPRVFPQAMAAGLPIVATRVDGAPDAVTPDENGWLVDVGDMRAMGEHLIALAGDRARARAMGAAGLQRVDAFSARRMVDQLESLYGNTVARAGSPDRYDGAAVPA